MQSVSILWVEKKEEIGCSERKNSDRWQLAGHFLFGDLLGDSFLISPVFLARFQN
jgi:hypothetical protein